MSAYCSCYIRELYSNNQYRQFQLLWHAPRGINLVQRLTGDKSPEAEMEPRRGTQGTSPLLRKFKSAWRTFHRTPECPRTRELTRIRMAPRTIGMGIAWRSLQDNHGESAIDIALSEDEVEVSLTSAHRWRKSAKNRIADARGGKLGEPSNHRSCA